MKTPTTLIIMDGFGMEGPSAGNAVVNASTPNLDKFFSQCPHSRLSASGLDVGLPDGQMGNSEVGHTNIGAGQGRGDRCQEREHRDRRVPDRHERAGPDGH